MGAERMLVVVTLATVALGSGCGSTSSDDNEPPAGGAAGTSGGKGGSAERGGTGSGPGGDGGTEASAAGGGGGEPMTSNLYIDIIRRGGEDLCLPRVLPVDQTAGSDSFGQVSCVILEATFEASCSCDAAGRSSADAMFQEPVRSTLETTGFCGGMSGQSCEPLCLCELEQFSGDDLARCQTELDPTDLSGFCYVDEDLEFVNPELVAACPTTMRRRLRFLEASGQTPSLDTITVLTCPGLAP